MFAEFSAAYYVGQLYIDQRDGEHAVMDRDQHRAANEQIYAAGEGIERLNLPLIMNLDESYFPVFGADDVSADTLAVPGAVLEATRIENPPTLKEVLVAKAEEATRLLDWATPYTLNESDFA